MVDTYSAIRQQIDQSTTNHISHALTRPIARPANSRPQWGRGACRVMKRKFVFGISRGQASPLPPPQLFGYGPGSNVLWELCSEIYHDEVCNITQTLSFENSTRAINDSLER